MTKENLSEMLDQAEWSWIAPHLVRDAVILVKIELDLVEVGEAVADNEVSKIQSLISSGALRKPTVEEIQMWNTTPTKRFLCLVVQPYVLIQELTEFH